MRIAWKQGVALAFMALSVAACDEDVGADQPSVAPAVQGGPVQIGGPSPGPAGARTQSVPSRVDPTAQPVAPAASARSRVDPTADPVKLHD